MFNRILSFYLLTGPPVFFTHPNSHVVTVGMNVSLYCNVSGTVVSYGWEMRSTTGGSWSRISNSNNYKYNVRNIQQSKQYRCVAGNDVGPVISKTATIQILSELIALNNNSSNLTDYRYQFSSTKQTYIHWLKCYINLYIINIISCEIFMDS